MSVFEKWSKGIEDRNADALIECLHDDFEFVRHQSGASMNKSQMAEMLGGFLSNDSVQTRSLPCLYENDEALVMHSVVDFADETTESIIAFHRLKDGKIFSMETGASIVSK